MLRRKPGSKILSASTWQRFSITGTFAGTATGVRAYINPLNDAGSAGDALAVYGELLEPGASASTYYPTPTLKGGDYIGVGGNVLLVGYAGASANLVGAMTVPLALPLPKAISSSAAVTVANATCLWEWDDDAPQFNYEPGITQGPITIPLRQAIA